MNGVSSECELFCQSDLVFIMLGGAYNGKTVPIKTQKCILAFDGNSGSTQQSRCAIFRGDAGVSVRNLDSRVLVNGEVRQEHWLQMGDRIEFPNSIVLEVLQLGYIGNPSTSLLQQPAMDASTATEQEFSAEEPDRANLESSFNYCNEKSWLGNDCSDEDQASNIEVSSNINPDLSSDVLSSVENRFHAIEDRLNQLADQISSLVTLASCGKLSSTSMPESYWEKQVNSYSASVPSPPPEPFVELGLPEVSSPETSAPTNRFNVAEFGPATNSSQSDPTCSENNPAETHSGCAAEIALADNRAELVPSRRVPVEKEAPVSVIEDVSNATSTNPRESSTQGLYELMESLAQGDSDSNQVPSNDASNDQSTLNQTSKFSTLGEIEPNPASVPPPAVPMAGEASVAKAASVDAEIDALLSRLFENQSTTPDAPLSDESQNQNREIQNQLANITDNPSDEPISAVSTNADPQTVNSTSENLYAGMKFGYDLSTNEPSFGNVAHHTIADPAAAPSLTQDPTPQHVQANSSEKVAAESMMDLLARLKQDGCWDSSENESDVTSGVTSGGQSNDEKNIPLITAPSQEETGFSDSAGAETIEASHSAKVENPPPQPPANAPDSVEDYMNQLLARMNVGLDTPEATKTKEQKIAANAKLAQAALDDANQNSELMTADEYVPKQKAAKIESLETMREIANTTARSAVAFSDLDRRKARGLMQCLIGFGAFIMAAYYFLFVSEALADTAFFVGLICLMTTGGASYWAFLTFKGTGILNDLFPQTNREK